MKKIILLLIIIGILFNVTYSGTIFSHTPLVTAIKESNFKKLNSILTKENINNYNKYGLSPLHIAIYFDNVKVIKYLFKRGANLNQKTKFNTNISFLTPLQLALNTSSCSSAHYLISIGGNVNAPDFMMNRPIHTSLLRCSSSVSRLLIQKGAKIKVKTYYDGDPMHRAVRSGKLENVKLVHKAGGDINAKTVYGITPLHYAVMYNFKHIVKYLLDNGANVNVRNKSGEQPIHRLTVDVNFARSFLFLTWKESKYVSSDWSVLNMLLAKGADVKSLNNKKETPLHIASYHDVPVVVDKLAVKELLNSRTINGDTPLHYTAMNGSYKSAVILLTKKANVNLINKKGQTALMIALNYRRNVEIIKILLKNNSNLNIMDNHGFNSLHYALKNGFNNTLITKIKKRINNKRSKLYLHCAIQGNNNAVMFKYIEFYKNNINLKDAEGNTPIFYAVKNGNLDSIKYLIANGSNIFQKNNSGETLLHIASYKNRFHIFKYLYNKGLDVNLKNKKNETPIHYILKKGDDQILKYLINKGQNVLNSLIINKEYYLHSAVQGGDLYSIKILIKLGAKLNLKDRYGKSPLMYSFRHYYEKSDKIFKYLISKKADLFLRNIDNSTLLHYAAEGYNLRIINYLFRSGFDINKKNNKGETPIFFSVRRKNIDSTAFLINKGAIVSLKNKTGKTPFDTIKHRKEEGFYVIRNILIRN